MTLIDPDTYGPKAEGPVTNEHDLIRSWLVRVVEIHGLPVGFHGSFPQRALEEFARLSAPIDVVLFCPQCGWQHIDTPEGTWTNPPHRSHLCKQCKHVWRPSDRCTNGVREVTTKGKEDQPAPQQTLFHRLQRAPQWHEVSALAPAEKPPGMVLMAVATMEYNVQVRGQAPRLRYIREGYCEWLRMNGQRLWLYPDGKAVEGQGHFVWMYQRWVPPEHLTLGWNHGIR